VHSCASETPWGLIRGAGARGLSADLAVLGAADLDVLAEALEAGEWVALGVVPATDPDPEPVEKALTERVLRLLDVVGLDPDIVGEQLVVTPACGMAGASPAWARRATELCAAVARNLASGTADEPQ
jgi:methionine synthase II (cobalamin-independent)